MPTPTAMRLAHLRKPTFPPCAAPGNTLTRSSSLLMAVVNSGEAGIEIQCRWCFICTMARDLTVMQLHLSAGCETVFVANLFVSIDLCAIGGQTKTSAQIVGCFLGFVTICWQSILKIMIYNNIYIIVILWVERSWWMIKICSREINGLRVVPWITEQGVQAYGIGILWKEKCYPSKRIQTVRNDHSKGKVGKDPKTSVAPT